MEDATATVVAQEAQDTDDDLRVVAARLEAHADQLATDVADHVHRQIPEFGTGASVTRQTRAAVRASITGFTRMLRQGACRDELIPAPEVLEYARAYVRRGMPMAPLLRIYRLGHAELWRIWSVQLAEEVDSPEQLLKRLDVSSRALFEYMDALTGWVVDEYVAERERWVRSAGAVRTETVKALLAGDAVDVDTASRALGYELRRWHVAAVVWAPEADGEDHSRFDRAVQDLATIAGHGGRW